MKERRKFLDVHDKPAEVGIKLNNVLTALVLMVMSWVGYMINDMTKNIGVIATASAVNQVQIDNNTKRIEQHIKNDYLHYNKD